MIQIVYVNIDMYNKVLILLYYWSLPTTNNSALIPDKGLLIKVFPVQGRALWDYQLICHIIYSFVPFPCFAAIGFVFYH